MGKQIDAYQVRKDMASWISVNEEKAFKNYKPHPPMGPVISMEMLKDAVRLMTALNSTLRI